MNLKAINDIPKLILVLGFFAYIVSLAVKYFKKDKYENKKITEYVIELLATFLGGLIAYPYYTDLMPIALWSICSGAIAALIVEGRRIRRSKL